VLAQGRGDRAGHFLSRAVLGGVGHEYVHHAPPGIYVRPTQAPATEPLVPALTAAVPWPAHIWSFCTLTLAQPAQRFAAPSRRYTGDRRSPSPSGRITLHTRVIIANFFGLICGDDHPCINRSARPRRSCQAELTTVAVSDMQASA
jgi:hypothetical protein